MNIKLTDNEPVQKNHLSIPRPLYIPAVEQYSVRTKDGGMRLCVD